MVKEQKIWFASDLHLGHSKLIASRPKNYENLFLNRWSKVVGNDDIFILLGDIAFSRKGYWFDRIATLPGKKVLVKGNHDKEAKQWYLNKGFEKVVAFGESTILKHDWGNILLSHIPASESVLASYDPSRYMEVAKKHAHEFDVNSCILNIHGHTHGRSTEAHNTFDATLEAIVYTPVLLSQILEWKFKN